MAGEKAGGRSEDAWKGEGAWKKRRWVEGREDAYKGERVHERREMVHGRVKNEW